MTGIVVQAQGARFIAEQDPQRVIAALEQIERAGAETMTSMRRMVGVLRNPDAPPDAPLAPLAGVADLAPLLEGHGGTANAPARLHVDGAAGRVAGGGVDLRVPGGDGGADQHPPARPGRPGRCTCPCVVPRTGCWSGSPTTARPRVPLPPGGTGFGLLGLTERVRAVGGTITAGPGVAGGWVVDAAFPLRSAVAR